ncbi:DUF6455 family protein [Celeribacter arenosi]|uniref:DUF6455 domain-containing protein n=1 Tax=Celeribacter arenosi TaxID=792649 RepID=A0ABP7K389_9RHOB
MKDLTKYDAHALKVDRMAGTLGVDLSEEMQRGNLSEEDLRDRVHRCLSCTEPDLCTKFLDTHTDGAARAPGYCRNKDSLEKLARP